MKFVIFFFLISNFTIFISNSSIVNAIEVGGHLIEDSIWSPDNNPYEVVETFYIDQGVTLTILPGTEVKVSGASCTNWQEQSQNFWLQNGISIAKMIWVEGKIIAEGTSQDSITFTRIQNDNNYYWGCIYLSPQSDMSRFQHCTFAYSAGIGLAVGNVAEAAVSIYNGECYINNCCFLNNAGIIITRDNLVKYLEITNNLFTFDNNIVDFIFDLWGANISISKPCEGFKSALVAGNQNNTEYISSPNMYYIYNNSNSTNIVTGTSGMATYFFMNVFTNFYFAIRGGDDFLDDLFYIKKNQFIDGVNAIDIWDNFVEISDNYFEDCDLDTSVSSTGLIFNNKINNGTVFIGSEIEFYNNQVCNYSGSNATFSAYDVHNLGNLFYNNENTLSDNNDHFHTNSIILQSDDLFWSPIMHGTDTFRNCIIDFELEYPLLDGGGNIIVDSIKVQTIFEDIQNGDFHLIEGSLAIDAGFDTLGYYYPFDMDYNHRVWDGNGNGSAIIDIGPYEYGSPAFGGIEGYTYNPTTNDPVDYVLLKINNQPGEFTFSDSIGNFEYRLPAGIYNVYAERVFYEDVIEYQIEVIDGEFTQIAIPMFETVDVEESTIISSANILNLINYPNPFNPTTTISFSVTQNSDFVNLEIYNIKGQKIKTLINETMQKGKHSIIWSGVDKSNKPISSGIYLYRIKVGNQESAKRMLLLK